MKSFKKEKLSLIKQFWIGISKKKKAVIGSLFTINKMELKIATLNLSLGQKNNDCKKMFLAD